VAITIKRQKKNFGVMQVTQAVDWKNDTELARTDIIFEIGRARSLAINGGKRVL
jgi:hypothetical protein